jgi:hypothetical protein
VCPTHLFVVPSIHVSISRHMKKNITQEGTSGVTFEGREKDYGLNESVHALANNQVSLFIICITTDSTASSSDTGPSMSRILFASNDKCSIYFVVYEYT